jgi:transcription initiation factor IIE alpha subunit
VLNKINVANLIALRNTQDTNKLLVALTEQQIIDAKRKRDAEAMAIDSHIQFMAQEQSVLRAQTGDPSARMLAYRIP